MHLAEKRAGADSAERVKGGDANLQLRTIKRKREKKPFVFCSPPPHFQWSFCYRSGGCGYSYLAALLRQQQWTWPHRWQPPLRWVWLLSLVPLPLQQRWRTRLHELAVALQLTLLTHPHKLQKALFTTDPHHTHLKWLRLLSITLAHPGQCLGLWNVLAMELIFDNSLFTATSSFTANDISDNTTLLPSSSGRSASASLTRFFAWEDETLQSIAEEKHYLSALLPLQSAASTQPSQPLWQLI